MIIQREIEAVMLAIDELVVARMQKNAEAARQARIEICDALKEVIRSAEVGK